MWSVLDTFITNKSGLIEHISSIDTFLFNSRSDDSDGGGGDDDNNSNNIIYYY